MSYFPAPRATEADCQRTIVEAARMCGWLVNHTRPALMRSGRWSTPVQGDPGYPDLTLVRDGRMLVVELKRAPYKPSRLQERWIAALRECGVDARIIWVPEGMVAFIAELTGSGVAA